MTSFTHIRELIPSRIPAEERVDYVLLTVWLVAMISLPIMVWALGDHVIPAAITAAAVLQASAVFSIVQRQWGLQRTVRALAIVALLSWSAEFIGHRTGFPFGAYEYTDRLQPRVAGVPLLIPIAWFMLMPSSWVMAQLITGKRDTLIKRLAFIILSALALTAWDFFLDPQMVGWNFWVWEHPTGYFGIPYTNFVGWLLVAGLITFAVNPPELKVMPLALIYGIVWFLQSFGQAVFWRQPGPALVGSVMMGSVMLLAWYRSKRTS